MANAMTDTVKAYDYFKDDNRLVYTQNGPMSQRYAMKTQYNNVAPASGWNYVPEEKYGEILTRYDPSGLGFDWTGKAKGAKEYVSNWFSGQGQKAPTWGDNALAAGVNYASGQNTAGITHSAPDQAVNWGASADQTSYNPTNDPNKPFYVAPPPGGKPPAGTPDPSVPPPAGGSPPGGAGWKENNPNQPPPPPANLTYTAADNNPKYWDAQGKFILPEGFDVSKGATGPDSAYINRVIYGADYFPSAKDPNFATYMASQGWQGAVPKNAQEFSALTPEQQGQYRTLLQRKRAIDTIDVGQGSADPAVNKAVYGDYFPGATNPQFNQWAAQQGGWVGNIPQNQEQFNQLPPEKQAGYRELLVKWNKGKPGPVLGEQPPGAGNGNGGGAAGGGGGNPPAGGGGNGGGAGGQTTGMLDWGQLGDYGFQFPLIPQFDPSKIEENPTYQYMLDKVMDKNRARLLAQGRSNSDYGANQMDRAVRELMAQEINDEYNRYIQDQQNARAWGTFGQGEDQRQFQNMFNLAQMGQQSASQMAGYMNQFGQNTAQLYDAYGTYIGDQSNLYAKQQADTTRNYVQTQLGLDAANAGTLINLLMGYGGNIADVLMWAADPTTQAALATAKAQGQQGAGDSLSAIIANFFQYLGKDKKDTGPKI